MSADVPPGRYWIRLEGPTPGWTLRSLSAEADYSDSPIELGPGDSATVTATFSSRPLAKMSGSVTARDGTAASTGVVFLISADPRHWDIRPASLRFTMTSLTGSGEYLTKNLLPGDYVAVAMSDTSARDWYKAGSFASLASVGTRVTLREGQTLVQRLRLTGLPVR